MRNPSSLEFILVSLLSHLLAADGGCISGCFGDSTHRTTADGRESASSSDPSSHDRPFFHWIVSVGWSMNGIHKHLCPGALRDTFGGCSKFPNGARRQVLLENGKIVGIESDMPHEGYNHATAENNIALLKLSEIVVGAGAKAADPSDWDRQGQERYVADWTSDGGSPPYKPVEYPMIIAKSAECERTRYPFISKDMICVREKEVTAGHSVSLDLSYGAPLYIKERKYRDDIIIGIYSQHLAAQKRDIYIRLSSYWGWMRKAMTSLLPQSERQYVCL